MTAATSAGERPDPGVAQAAEAGIHLISLATPFAIGRVNCYLIEDDPLTLVDVGPNSGQALDELASALRARGHTLEDLGLVVLTHQHLDHMGLIEVIERHTDAEVAAFDQLGPYLADFPASAREDDEFSIELMLRHGVPAEVARALGLVAEAFRNFGSPGRVSRLLADGDALELRDRTLRVAHRPGHSPTDTVFHDEQLGILISGDHLLSRISSNPVITRPPTGATQAMRDGTDRPHALQDYITSMTATRAMAARLTLGGHGPTIADHVSLIDERLSMHEQRKQRIAGLLGDGPHTAHEIALAIWHNVAVTQAFLTLSEVLGHLDLLIADDVVVEDSSAPVTRFSLA